MDKQWPKVTLDTPIEELKDIHKRIWDECIDKYDGIAKPETPYRNDCIGCEIASLRASKEHEGLLYLGQNYRPICCFCPIFEEDDHCLNTYIRTLYDFWYVSGRNREKRIKYAKQIRDYKWREENG